MTGPERLYGRETLRMMRRDVPIRTVVLLNPNAGQGDWSADRLGAALQDAGLSPRIIDIKRSDPQRALVAPADLYVIAGGDGTVAKIAPLLPRGARFAVLPLGTANNVARAHGIHSEPGMVISHLPDADECAFPLLRVEANGRDQVLTEALGLGALSASMEMAEAGKTGSAKIAEGRRSFAQALRQAIPKAHLIEVEGNARESELLMLEALAHGRAGPGLQLLPEPVRPGRVGLFTVTPKLREPLLRWLEEGADGPAPGHVEQASEVRIACGGTVPLRLDDEMQHMDQAPRRLVLRGMDPNLRLLVPGQGSRT